METEDETSYDLDYLLQAIREKLSWIDTGKAAKYREEEETYKDIAKLAQRIIWYCEGEIWNLNKPGNCWSISRRI